MPASPRPELDVMLEVEGDAGGCLWEALTDINSWVLLAPEQRTGAFARPRQGAQERLDAAAARHPELADALRELGRLSREPGEVTPASVADACEQVLRWAEAAGLRETALQFAEAAARVEPEASMRSYTAGRLSRESGEPERGRIWLDRAVRLARRAGNEIDFANAHLGLGVLEYNLGRYDQAEGHLWKAVRASLRNGRKSLAGLGHHNLMTVQVDRGRFADAMSHAWAALDCYPLKHPLIPNLGHDVAFLFVQQQHFSYALLLLEAVRPWIEGGPGEPLLRATLVRCAAAVRDRLRYGRHFPGALASAELRESLAPMALYRLAEAAYAFAEVDQARELANRSLTAAEARKNATIIERATQLLVDISENREPRCDVAPAPHGPESELTEAVLQRLKKLPPPKLLPPYVPPEDYPAV